MKRTLSLAALVLTCLAVSACSAPSADVDDNDDELVSSAESAFDLREAPRKRVLDFTWQGQPNRYWCGPGSTRMALSAKMADPPSQQTLATYMGTTTNGTDHIGLPVKALNNWLNPEVPYRTRTIDWVATQPQRDLLKQDILARIGSGWPIVANVVSGWRPPGYPTGTIYHYVAVLGYDDNGEKVLIADPAGAGSAGPIWNNVPKTYWISLHDLGTWIGGKGYTG